MKLGDKLRLQGRIEGFALNTLLREIEDAVNLLIDAVTQKANHGTPLTADGLVKSGKAVFKGYNITVVTAAGTIDIRDSTSAGGGQVIETIPAGTAVGRYERTIGINCDNGIYVDYNAGPATGTIVVLYE